MINYRDNNDISSRIYNNQLLLPKGSILYRGNKWRDPNIRDTPKFYGSRKDAFKYAGLDGYLYSVECKADCNIYCMNPKSEHDKIFKTMKEKIEKEGDAKFIYIVLYELSYIIYGLHSDEEKFKKSVSWAINFITKNADYFAKYVWWKIKSTPVKEIEKIISYLRFLKDNCVAKHVPSRFSNRNLDKFFVKLFSECFPQFQGIAYFNELDGRRERYADRLTCRCLTNKSPRDENGKEQEHCVPSEICIFNGKRFLTNSIQIYGAECKGLAESPPKFNNPCKNFCDRNRVKFLSDKIGCLKYVSDPNIRKK